MLVTVIRRLIGVLFLTIGIPQSGSGQTQPAGVPPHEHPTQAPEASVAAQHQHQTAGATLFPTREASGTAWLPDVTPMYGFHYQTRGWEVMLHGNAFLQVLHEAAPIHRGATQAGSINWLMAMGRRPLARGTFGLRTMISLEPWTIAGCGYPNLLATGEICDGDTIHDKQHPHDFFMELTAEVQQPLTGALRWHLYGGLAGEPALGPPGFPHRISAMPNPLSPIAHHWLDSTHITFGVVTTGVATERWKVEGSVFNGREPDQRRYDLDLGRLDSVAGRIWFVPNETLALQVSAGRLTDAHAHPGGPLVDARRATVSATYHRRGNSRLWASTLAWGANRELGLTTHALILESALSRDDGATWFGRLELNGKPAHDLHVHELTHIHEGYDLLESSAVLTVGKLQAGYTRYFAARGGWSPGVGASISAIFLPATLKPRYGLGVGAGVFLTLRPAVHEMAP
jgi:hypothetical protein